ncbi:ATP-binding protein [Calothrix sp. PCC 6303]|uniref:hybrid sensor histidine kinase/response regulator n=1 Tax=Calothrix sp. PCC 6303 TaxID=1170562 RepID=UPI0002A00966|nr:ATP-binding protein [Calothrix sp. PCC 6303]AFY99205.1 response regulator receiver sensor signal transduction histidine kinase [Calothrix sp. PCC 6303]
MKKRILIIEDERIIACDIKHYLENSGYCIPGISAYGEDAIEQAGILQPDLILMDIMLKGDMNGIEAAQEITNRYHIPIVYLTAFSDQKTLEKAKITQPFGYILKPFDERQLITTIEVALNLHQTENMMQKELVYEKEKNDIKSRFVSMVSHEFRNPLTTILASAELLKYHNENIEESKRNEYIDYIQKSVQQMSQLLSDVLLIGKSELNKLEFEPQALQLEIFCQELVRNILYSTNNQNFIKFRVQGSCPSKSKDDFSPENLPLWDKKLLYHILNNLLTNAIKYSKERGVVNFDLFCLEKEVVFRIQDEGIGIPDQDQEELFTSFYRGKNVRDIPGNGLGLAIVKQSVELHGGEITFVSLEGVGTTFIVSIPYQYS